MNEDYKNNDVSHLFREELLLLTYIFKCYYLMSFDQHMIIDATKGSIARFVNHSCKPNCKMVKWIVGGKPRMALFAGDKPIMTGDELTYDYNFDPFSAKNVQECRCGSDNCRGVLGPKPKDFKPIKETIKDVVKAGVKAGKRKLKELLGGAESEDEDFGSPKKRKIKQLKTVRKSASSASMRVAKRTVKTVRKTVSSQVLKKAGSKRENVFVKTVKGSSLKTYGKGQTKLASKNSSLTIVAGESSPESKGSSSGTEMMSPKKNIAKKKRGPRKAKPVLSEEYITVESGSSEEELEDPDETEEEIDEHDW
jgi:histone-lysine N-methyltransferase ASH1L